jgi:4'-phosphopantetheinyl transferase
MSIEFTHSRPPLQAGEIHVWRSNLRHDGDVLATMRACLSTDETARADQFIFEKDRHAFIAARGILRQILSTYTGISPSAISFGQGSKGKPYLKDNPALRFNISHSENVALYAFSCGIEVGIDVQRIDPGMESHDLIHRFFSAVEVSEFESLPQEAQTEAFYCCWTRKEAFLKASGEGLSFPLNGFSVPICRAVEGPLLDYPAYTVWNVPVGPGYAAALVAVHQSPQVKHFTFGAI